MKNASPDTETKSQSRSSRPCRKYAGSASASASCGPGRRRPRTTSRRDRPDEEQGADDPGLAQELHGQVVRLDRLVEARRPVAQVRALKRPGAGAPERRAFEPSPRLLPPRLAEVPARGGETRRRVRQLGAGRRRERVPPRVRVRRADPDSGREHDREPGEREPLDRVSSRQREAAERRPRSARRPRARRRRPHPRGRARHASARRR